MRFRSFANDWEESSLGKECFPLSYGLGAKAVPFDGIHRYLRITDIGNEEKEFVSPDFLDEKAILKSGDLLLARTGATVGRSYLYQTDGVETFYAGFLIRARSKVMNPYFLYCATQTDRYLKWVKTMSARSGQPGINAEEFSSFKVYVPAKEEANKIASFLFLVDRRIAVQNKIIEELKTLELSLIDEVFSGVQNATVGEFAYEVSERNRDEAVESVYSVSNKSGFVPQNEQFEDKEVASTNKSNYKVVRSKTFAYNPARINVGSIGYFEGDEPVIISPMYVCFRVRGIEEGLLKQFFLSNAFYRQMQSRLEGSVRQCLTFDGMRTIKIHVPNRSDMKLLNLADLFRKKKEKESRILEKFLAQKSALLLQMFI